MKSSQRILKKMMNSIRTYQSRLLSQKPHVFVSKNAKNRIHAKHALLLATIKNALNSKKIVVTTNLSFTNFRLLWVLDSIFLIDGFFVKFGQMVILLKYDPSIISTIREVNHTGKLTKRQKPYRWVNYSNNSSFVYEWRELRAFKPKINDRFSLYSRIWLNFR